MVSVQIRRQDEIGDDLERQLAEWTEAIFGADELKYTWAEQHWRVLVYCEGQLASTLAITEREAMVGGKTVTLAGIGNVMTPPEWRRRGLAARAMQEAAEFLCDEIPVDFGFILCSHDLIPYYQRLGWRQVNAPVVFDQPTGKVRWQEEAMALPCAEHPWPDGTVDLCGLPW